MSDKLVIFDEVQHKVLKIRIYPNQDQTILINKTFGSCRKLYNEHLQERKWTCPKCETSHICDVNAAINLKNYVPMEGRELTPVESDKVKSLALLALQVGSLDEAGKHSQATSGRNVLGL